LASFRIGDDPTGTIGHTGIGSLKDDDADKASLCGEAMAEDFFDKTHLMEVHLNIQSSLNLQPLADAFRSDVHVHFSKVVNGVYGVRVGLSEFLEFPDPTVTSLCKAVCELPESARNLWSSASARTFDIGIEAAVSSTYWFALTPQTLNTLAKLGAQVVVTVNGPDSKEK
jgi:hypothetical protein